MMSDANGGERLSHASGAGPATPASERMGVRGAKPDQRERAQRSEPPERSEAAQGRASDVWGSPKGEAPISASERSEASHANGARRRSGARESV
jgi:hypothetical protein